MTYAAKGKKIPLVDEYKTKSCKSEFGSKDD
jgi:hypothetical protein